MAEQFEQQWEELTAGEQENFQRCLRQLLKQTFLVADKNEESRRAYFFVSRKQPLFSQYLKYMGFDVLMDRENRVVMLQNIAGGSLQGNKLNFSLAESIVLCCLWSLYVDRLSSGPLSRSIDVPLTELRFQFDKYGVRDKMDKKGVMDSALKTMRRFNLVDLSADIGDPDCMIRIYPSVQFALNLEEFKSFAADAEKRFSGGVKAGTETENAQGEATSDAEDEEAADEDEEDMND